MCSLKQKSAFVGEWTVHISKCSATIKKNNNDTIYLKQKQTGW